MLWVGSQGGMEEGLVGRAAIPFRGVATGKLRGADPIKGVKSAAALAQGMRQSSALIGEFAPDVCFVTGGYVCAPVVAACSMKRIPIIIYLPDMTPGWTIQWMSKVAQRVAVSFPEVAPWFGGLAPKGKAVVTGYPVRDELVKWSADRPGARRKLAQALERPTLDGARCAARPGLGWEPGARVINEAVWASLAQVLPTRTCAARGGDARLADLCGTGRDTGGDGRRTLHLSLSSRRLLARRNDAGACRRRPECGAAGASTLGEFPVAHLPSVLVPLVGVNQTANADLLAGKGGALIIAEETLQQELPNTLQMLLQDPARRFAMEERAAQARSSRCGVGDCP